MDQPVERPKILIVDDAPTNIHMLIKTLKDEYDVIPAKNGKTALDKAQNTPQPDLILLDILMPDMDGYEVCKRLKENEKTKKIPIIFLTAVSEAMDEAKAFRLGAIDYITKPFIPLIVKARVKTHLALKQYQTNLEKIVAERTRELQIAKIAAEEANRSKSTFLMNMSHELRTPLNGVLACTDMITENEPIEEILKLRNTIRSSSYSLLNTIEQILEFTKSKDRDLKLAHHPFKLSDILNEIKTEFVHKGRTINLIPQIRIDGDSIPNNLIGDAKHLNTILNSIIENAAIFTREEPEATLTLNMVEKTKQDVIIRFSIADNGIGIDPNQFEKIFEPFCQVDSSSTREFDGTGMGLSLCKQLVELMGGDIWVESELGKGSIFYFTTRFKVQELDEPLNIDLLKELKDYTLDSSDQKESLIASDPEKLSPIIIKLRKALLESDPTIIHKCLSEIKVYNMPRRQDLLKKIENYEYDEAISLLNEITTEVGM